MNLVYPATVSRHRSGARALLAISLLGAFAIAACDRPPSDGIRPWAPQDHDHSDNQQGAPAPSSAEDKRAMMIETAWSQNCAVCHGPMGHGDGPNGALVKAPDLTRADWQAKVTDEEIATRIREGKGLMPKFTLPDELVLGLVARIRITRGR
ncbi:hypothetical protein BH09MYX1_BH09MYX1_52080 [soil metagenome]